MIQNLKPCAVKRTLQAIEPSEGKKIQAPSAFSVHPEHGFLWHEVVATAATRLDCTCSDKAFPPNNSTAKQKNGKLFATPHVVGQERQLARPNHVHGVAEGEDAPAHA